MKLATIGLFLILVTGCASVGRKLDESKIDQIKKGKTTRQEVLALVGSPDQMTHNGSGETTFTYLYARATATPATYIPIVGAFAGGANVQHQMLMVTFGSDGFVKDFISSYGATESGTGMSTGSKANINDLEADKRPK